MNKMEITKKYFLWSFTYSINKEAHFRSERMMSLNVLIIGHIGTT